MLPSKAIDDDETPEEASISQLRQRFRSTSGYAARNAD